MKYFYHATLEDSFLLEVVELGKLRRIDLNIFSHDIDLEVLIIKGKPLNPYLIVRASRQLIVVVSSGLHAPITETAIEPLKVNEIFQVMTFNRLESGLSCNYFISGPLISVIRLITIIAIASSITSEARRTVVLVSSVKIPHQKCRF